MTERKFVRLWITAFVAVVLVFAGTVAWAATAGPCQKTTPPNTGLPAGECVNLYGYDVWVSRGDSGSDPFPVYNGPDSIYSWKISSFDGKYAVGHLDIQIPGNIAPYTYFGSSNIEVKIDSCSIPYNSSTPANSWYVYDLGKGDPSTGFASYEMDKYVLKITPPTSGDCRITASSSAIKTVQVKFKGKILSAGLDEFMVKSSTKGTTAAGLPLLGPALNSSSTTASNAPPVRSDECFAMGDTGCAMCITLKPNNSIGKASVITDPLSNTECNYTGPLTPTPIKRSFVCDKNPCDIVGSDFICPGNSTPNYNCFRHINPPYPDAVGQYICYTAPTDCIAIDSFGTYACSSPPVNTCVYDASTFNYTCNSTPPSCSATACPPLNCLPKAFVERNIMNKSGEESRWCYTDTTGQQVCRTTSP